MVETAFHGENPAMQMRVLVSSVAPMDEVYLRASGGNVKSVLSVTFPCKNQHLLILEVDTLSHHLKIKVIRNGFDQLIN